MKRWMIVLLLVVVVVVGGFFTVVYYVGSTRAWVQALELPATNLAAVADGVYEGTSHLKLPSGTAAANSTASVRVTVRDHRFASIEVIAPEPIAARMTEFARTVVDRQSTRLDALSGATVTKVAVLLAIADAVSGK